MKTYGKYGAIIGASLALGLLLYAVPRLEIGAGWTPGTMFGVAWICLMLLIIAAHLHEMLGVDEGTRRRLRHVKRMRQWQMEQRVVRGLKIREVP